ncbi:MAG TPA: hypothetical protein ENI31_03380 [Candidatus Omnitrophica bacterium]|nr:MAG: hypothetical protein DRP61_00090 [Candidatus Omnitrophota bacterium]RKY44872.1 MAG: hypothetical protein DRP80_00755 [Candidatus Omnitrophota bacterium]HEC69312.1 hypothetical protein [Candidatus Omnitrophota bacterium]
MIKIEFSWFLAFYVGGHLVLFFISWLREKISGGEARFSISKKFLRQCSICTYTYFLSHDLSLSRCPFCGSLNKKSESED